jgi:decaprenylphospho-beta-D-erythro-pentofuranosid-2-ulose 2-reductase
MTSGLDEVPLAVTPDQVADAVIDGIKGKRELVWVPGPLRLVMSGLRHVPRPVFRKLPL